jgi:hypothetical protein
MANIKGIVRNESLQPVNGFLVRAHRLDTGAVLGEATSAAVTTGDPLESMVALRVNFDNGVAVDTSQYAHSVALLDGAVVAPGAGKFGDALDVSSVLGASRLEVPNSASTRITGPFCLEFFAKLDTVGTKATFAFGAASEATLASNMVQLLTYGTSDTHYAKIFNPVLGVGNWPVYGQWVHVAVTMDASLMVRYYINGVLNNEQAGTAPIDMLGPPLWSFGGFAGGAGGTPNYPFLMDGIRLTIGSERYPAAGFTPPTEPFLPPVTTAGVYDIAAAYSGECYVVCLDDAGAPVRNHQILRTTTA